MDSDSTHFSGRYVLNTGFDDPVLFSGMTLVREKVIAYKPNDGFPIIIFCSSNPALVEKYKFIIDGEEYHFIVQANKKGKYQYSLLAIKGNIRQKLFRFNNTQYNFVSILWLGDLDCDKRPDFFMNSSSELWKSVF